MAPKESGGCAVTGYEIYMDDGLGGTVTNQDLTLVNNDPSILSHTIDLSGSGVVGNVYNFKIKALTYAGSVESSALPVALASKPD